VPESDIGRVVLGPGGQMCRVDAFPDRRFAGTGASDRASGCETNNVNLFLK